MSKVDVAMECFNGGFSCSQAVFSTYCEQLGLDKENALKLSCGFGGGMGRLGETCGAVTGAYMLIGLKYGMTSSDDKNAKEITYEMIRKFTDKFKERNTHTSCRDLLGVDLLTGDKNFAADQVKLICPRMVRDAAEIIEEMLGLE